jgi:hypothetical protein
MSNNYPNGTPKRRIPVTPRHSVIDCGRHIGSTALTYDERGICTAFGVQDWHRGRMRTRVYNLDPEAER